MNSRTIDHVHCSGKTACLCAGVTVCISHQISQREKKKTWLAFTINNLFSCSFLWHFLPTSILPSILGLFSFNHLHLFVHHFLFFLSFLSHTAHFTLTVFPFCTSLFHLISSPPLLSAGTAPSLFSCSFSHSLLCIM